MTSPYTTLKHKTNTAMVETAFRNRDTGSLYLWVFCKALDIDLNGKPTGRVYNVPKAIKILALKMRRSERSIRRMLHKADEGGWLTVHEDRIQIPSRSKVTLALWALDRGGTAPNGNALPDGRMRDPRDSLEISVSIPEIWDSADKGRSRSLLLDIVRERCTSYGWCRETFAALVGMERTSTARLDRAQGARRGWQFATIGIDNLALHPLSPEQRLALGKNLEAAYKQCRGAFGGRGHKIWLGRGPDGETTIFTQLPVKWDTRFRGRFSVDKDVVALTNSTISQSMLDECGSLRSARKIVSGRETRDIATNNTLSDSMCNSLWRLTSDMARGAGMTSFNPRPTIRLSEHVAWQAWTSQSPNPGHQLRKEKDLREKNEKKS